jgi:hypothetical protein
MRALFLLAVALLFLSSASHAQIKLQENFETSDSTHIPVGWTHWNEAGFPPQDSTALWTVQDTGRVIPGIVDIRRTVARSGTKAIRVSWIAGRDTGGINRVADDWLITRRINNIAAGDSLKFWATGGNGGTTGQFYPDTLEIWIGDVDSLPASQVLMLGLITWRNGTSLYGVFKKYSYSLQDAIGFNIFVGLRYHIDVSVDGYAVHLDDIQVAGPLTEVRPSRGIPDMITLSQNYPNPFNPSTTIVWTVPTASKVTLKIYNPLGQEVGTLVDAKMDPGEYSTAWDARGFPTGAYFYRLQIGNTVQTRKLVLVK